MFSLLHLLGAAVQSVLVTSFGCSGESRVRPGYIMWPPTSMARTRLDLTKAAGGTHLTHLSQDLSEVFKRGCAGVLVDEASSPPQPAPGLLMSMWHFSSCLNCQSCLNWYFQTVFFKQFLHLTIKQKFLTRILGPFLMKIMIPTNKHSVAHFISFA